MKNKAKKVTVAALAVLALGSGSAFAAYSASNVAGPKTDGTGVTPSDWMLTPAGTQQTLGDFPMGGAVSPDHKYLVVSNDGQGTQSLQVVDVKQQKVIQTIPYTSPESLYLGVAFSPDGKTLYASAGGNNKIRTFSFDNGMLTEKSPILLKDSSNTNFYPAGLSISNDGKFLYVANNVANSVSQIDLASGKIAATVPVGKNPYTAFLSHDGSKLYVSNWGESSISVLDPNSLTVQKTIKVGLHPNAIAENPVNGFIYVANSDSDEVSIIDPGQQQVVQTVSLAPYRGAQTGSQPDALTVSPDGKTLYVANAGNNDVAVIGLGNTKENTKAQVKGLIPTAWYPTGVYMSDNQKLMVLNAKGLGAGPNVQKQYIGSMIQGTMSFIDVPNQGQLQKYTKQVQANNRVRSQENQTGNNQQGNDEGGNNKQPIPRFASQHSPIKHVIYVLKENRTYDQVFGDLKKGNGDPSLTSFGQNVTPNLHKLANQFVTLDNFYANAEISAQGHNWATAAKANDYTEKNWLANYSGRNRGYDFEGQSTAASSKAGYIWNNAMRSGVSFRDYGEFTDWVNGEKSGISKPNDASIGNNYDPNYPSWSFNYSDVQREQEWEKEFKQFEQNNNLPQLEIVRLPNDHTAGTKPGALTPEAMVAQNDLAVGKLVDAVSHSKYWKDTAIFITEDDAQNGYDHVDAHRTESLVVSPYTQKGTVDSTFYDTAAMLRTMELILGLNPMTQYDAAATPMLNSFTTKPNNTPYTALEPTYPLNQKNGENAPGAQASAKMDFSKQDSAPSDQLNKVLWKATKGDKPYPVSKN
ncbi:glutaminyl-peptide cyclotransferase [Aneurinibacillus sp. Ricciae_BoGa-3]|uniref:glutaminyl-peptide cyclotransferase n=1 Tax=Aneurinibacillus sp. Ricciae_BoGa-3 TaxID=3022697 RepID=UPI0023425F97|nr:glutaminyl-peptide cyclotransferase [Aneurinibacillus sp. Ricciae_BoGa-3]WCK54881.1 glutaminyl-peptide cyclotransferase [Aneurinibacillus sp. Ricciae_BoGa-3]